MPKFTQKNRAAAVGTPLADDHLLLKGMSGYDAISQPFHYNVELLSEDPNIAFEDLIGESLTIRLNHVEGGDPRYFNGIVADLKQIEPVAGMHSYQAMVVPWLWFLKKAADCRIFQVLSVPEILEEVFKAHGFEDFELRLSSNYPKLEYCVQYRESDFAFVSRLMEEVGIYYFFIHENGKHTLILADSKAAHDPCPGFEKIKYIGPSGNTTGANEIVRWEQRKQVTTGAFALNDFNFAEPKKQLYPTAQNEMSHNLAAFEEFTYEGEYTEEGGSAPAGKLQLEELAKIRLSALQAEHAVAYAESDCRGLQAGHTFTLEQCYRSDQDGGYFITSVHHQIALDNYVSGGGGTAKEYSCAITAIAETVEYRPQRVTPKPRVAGPQTAIVVGRAGEEIDTDEFGRVKVQFHWDRESKADENSSCWVRVSQNWAGKKWGAFFIPRIGQEVIVDFLEGDPDRPIITGRVYNGDNMPPYELPAEKTKSTIKSHSSKDKDGHNELRFEDKAGQEQIYMHAEKDMDVRVKNNYKETNYGHRDIRVGWEKDGKRGGNFNTLVRYDENRHIENDHYEMVDKDSHQTIKGERTEKFEKSQKTFVQNDAVLNADNQITETKTAISLKTDKYTLQGATGVHLKSQTINLEATNISLKCGGSFVHIGPAGVDIKGPMVKINSGGSAQSAEDPKALPEISVLEPLDASVATNSKSGGVGSAVARSVTRGGGVIEPHLAPEFRSLPSVSEPKPAKPIVPPPAPQKPCGISELDLHCEHNKRTAVGGRLLVVPTPASSTSHLKSIGYGDYKFSYEIGKKAGGTDTVSLQLKAETTGYEKYALSKSPSAGRAEWTSGASADFPIKSVSPTQVWLKAVEPEKSYIYGKGCDETIQSCEILVFPSNTYEYSLKLEGFRQIVKEINDVLEELFKRNWGPVEIKPSIVGPSGELKASHGWKEDTAGDKAFYHLAVNAGVSPIGGISFDFRISLLQVAGAGGLTAIGIPPNIGQLIMDKLTKYLADIFVGADVKVKLGIVGNYTRKWYYEGEVKNEGKAGPEVSGEVGIYLGASLGNKDILGAELIGRGSTGLKASGAVKGDDTGIALELALTCPGIEVTVSITFQSFIWDTEEEFKWNPIQEFDVFEPKTIQLMQFDDE